MNVIPLPLLVEAHEGQFCLGPDFGIHSSSDGTQSLRHYLTTEAKSRFGLIVSDNAPPSIFLNRQARVTALSTLSNSDEGYELIVSTEHITITAEHRSGVFYGIQTLLQLFPSTPKQIPMHPTIPCVKVERPWVRKMMREDVGRHFYTAAYIKRFLDQMAFYKLNRFHWHLTEDQGWRIEIKKYPLLTEIGAWREREGGGDRYGGFYSQAEISEIVAYAKERCIEVMPEIEMPGHCAASLAGYPHLSCKGERLETPTKWGIYEDVYCPGKDSVLEFLKDTLDEVIQLFPFEYIHIGGDETPKDRWKECEKCQMRMDTHNLKGEDELQSWFISEIAEYLYRKKRKIIGWDEILEGGVPKNATVMSWRGIIGGFIAAKLGHDVIMSPTSHCYFDYRQSDNQDEPGAYYATLTLENVYNFEPIPDARLLAGGDSPASSEIHPSPSSNMEISEVSEATVETTGMDVDERLPRGNRDEDLRPEEKLAEEIHNGCIPAGLTKSEQQHILGGQANVWTEYIEDEETCDYMLFPRLCAFSEAVWLKKESKNWEDFMRRVALHMEVLEAMGVGYRRLDA